MDRGARTAHDGRAGSLAGAGAGTGVDGGGAVGMAADRAGSAGEVFGAFLRLGLSSFGGPIAHVGYFRNEFVQRRGWLDDARFARLLALCQFLPGPASSQLGFAIGLLRAGWGGAFAAFVGFTAPSALLMFAFAGLSPRLAGASGAAAIHGLKLVAVVVVAAGVLGMARQLAADLPRALIAVAAGALVLFAGSAWVQLAAIAGGALLGLAFCRRVAAPPTVDLAVPAASAAHLGLLALFLAGLGVSTWVLQPTVGHAIPPTPGALAAAFYQAGALVFGGGHVVLPLLERSVVDSGWLDAGTFLSGYGAAQAVPGPMFSLAAFLGAAVSTGLHPALGAAIALAAIFLPGGLLLAAVLPAWGRFGRSPAAAAAIAGVNAAVVGLLGAALYDPVWTQAVHSAVDLAIVLAGFALLVLARVPVLAVVLGCVATAVGFARLAG